MSDIATLGIKIDSTQAATAATALDNLTASAKPASTAVGTLETSANKATLAKKSLAAATAGVSGQLIALSAGAGPVGVFLSALGPWGLAASVGLGAATAAFSYMREEATRMGQKAIDIRSFTAATELTVQNVAALKRAGSEFGVTGETIQTSFERLTGGLQDARRATGPLYEDVLKIDAGLARQLQTAEGVTGGINVLAKAWERAGDASSKVDLAKSIFGRGGATLGPLLGKIAEAGGLGNLTQNLHDVGEATDNTTARWAQMQATIDLTEKRAKNILASIFTEDGLSASLAAAQYMERFALAAQKAATTKIPTMESRSAVGAGFGSELDLTPPNWKKKQEDAWNLPQETLTSWGQFEDSLSKVTPIAERAAAAIANTGKSVKQLQDDAAAASKTQQELISFLGSAATVSERLTARLKDIDSAYKDNRTGAATEGEAKLLKSRAEGAAALDALIQRESMRVGVLGALATVADSVRQKELEINKANQQGAGITDTQTKAILAYTAAQTLGTLAIRQQTEAAKIEAGAVGLGIGATAAFRAEQDLLAAARLKNQTLLPGQIADIRKEAAALGAAAQKAAELRAQSDLLFASSQLGRTSGEETVAAQLRAIYGDKFESEMNGNIAATIRFNDTLKQTKAFGEEALSGFLRDIRDGKSGTEALQNVLVKLENKLFDIASNKILSGLVGTAAGGLGGIFGGAAGSASNPYGGAASTGSIAPSIAGSGGGGFAVGGAHAGAIVGSEATFTRYVHPAHFNDAPRFHTGGLIGAGERPIIAQDGEGIFTAGQMKAIGRGMSRGSGPVQATVVINGVIPADTKATATASSDGNGGMRIDVMLARMVDDTTADHVNSGQSAINASIERRYGLTPKL